MNNVANTQLLRTIYYNVYGEQFHPECMDDRVMLQKAVFCMRELGVSCGKYRFVWDQYGPYSPTLSDDMKRKENIDTSQEIVFNDRTLKIMQSLKEMAGKETTYTVRYWMEAIASLLYMKKYMYPSLSDEMIIAKLESKKGTLQSHEDNIRAMDILRQNFRL